MVNLAKKSLVSTKGTLGSALETLSEKKKNYPILRKNIKESKQTPLFKKPQEKLCAFSFSRRYIETINMRKVQFLIFSIVFTEYFYHFTAWRYWTFFKIFLRSFSDLNILNNCDMFRIPFQKVNWPDIGCEISIGTPKSVTASQTSLVDLNCCVFRMKQFAFYQQLFVSLKILHYQIQLQFNATKFSIIWV